MFVVNLENIGVQAADGTTSHDSKDLNNAILPLELCFSYYSNCNV